MAHSLTVERLLSTYLVPQDHPAPDEVRRELDEVARKYVSDSCARALSSLLDPRDPSVWLIDKVSIDVLMDVHAAGPDDVADFWAGKLAESVAHVIARGEDGDRVMRFADRPAYLAYFLRDLAAGVAWSKWYYRQFESLRSLPTGAAVREALLREPEVAEQALVHLSRTKRMDDVANVLSQSDQERLLQLFSPQEAMPGKKCFQAAMHEWFAAAGRSRRALDLYLRVRSEHPEFPVAEIRAAVRHVVTIGRWQQSSQLADILAAVASDRFSQTVRQLSPEEQDTALYAGFLVREDSSMAGRLAEMAGARGESHGAKQKQQDNTEKDKRFASPWSGVFLVLPALMSNRELMAGYGHVEDQALRYLLLAACLKASDTELRFDHALALAAGFAAPPEISVLQKAQPRTAFEPGSQDLLPEDLRHIEASARDAWPELGLDSSARKQLEVAAALLVRNFARQLPGLGRSSIDYLWRNVLSGDGTVTVAPGRIFVNLAPRPLAIVLRMAGFNELRFTPPWMAETEVVVHFDGQ